MSDETNKNDVFIAELRQAVGAGNVVTDARDLHPYLEDWRSYGTGVACAAVLPASTEQVAEVIRIAGRWQRSIVPQGGNTGLCLAATPLGLEGSIVLGLRRLNAVREIDKASNVIVVEAGIPLAAVHEVTAEIGRRVPLHLGSEGTAQIGGLVSTNAGGTGALRYGPMRDLVCGVEVVLPDGRILSDLSALRKNNTGYDLKHLFIGAEGTLGIITAVALRMHPLVRASAHAWIVLPGLEAVTSLLTSLQDRFDTAIQAAELLSGNQIDLVLEHIPRSRLPLSERPEWSLLVELGSSDPNLDLKGMLEDWLVGHIESGEVPDAFVAQNEAQALGIWHVRHSVSEANKIHGHSLSHDVAVRTAMVPQMIQRGTARVGETYPGANILIVSHIGDGNVHFIVHFTHDEWGRFSDPRAVTEDVMNIVHDIVAELGGTFSAEHGIGRKLTAELALRADPTRLEVMLAVKHALDPSNRMNPGVLFKG